MKHLSLSEFAIYLLAVIFILWLVYQNISVIPAKPTLTQEIEEVVFPIKHLLGSRKFIAVVSNNDSLQVFFNTQFALVPVIAVKDTVQDTLLYIEDLKMKPLTVFGKEKSSRILAMHSGRRFRAMLIKSEK